MPAQDPSQDRPLVLQVIYNSPSALDEHLGLGWHRHTIHKDCNLQGMRMLAHGPFIFTYDLARPGHATFSPLAVEVYNDLATMPPNDLLSFAEVQAEQKANKLGNPLFVVWRDRTASKAHWQSCASADPVAGLSDAERQLRIQQQQANALAFPLPPAGDPVYNSTDTRPRPGGPGYRLDGGSGASST